MARQRRVTRAELLRQACEENYDGYNPEQIKEEIARISKINFSLVEDKKDTVKALNDVIKENVDKIEYLVEKLDAVRHDAGVAAQLGN
jgi:predicted transcriptional regulator